MSCLPCMLLGLKGTGMAAIPTDNLKAAGDVLTALGTSTLAIDSALNTAAAQKAASDAFKPPVPQPEQTNWWPWIIGGAVIVGLVVLVAKKKGS